MGFWARVASILFEELYMLVMVCRETAGSEVAAENGLPTLRPRPPGFLPLGENSGQEGLTTWFKTGLFLNNITKQML